MPRVPLRRSCPAAVLALLAVPLQSQQEPEPGAAARQDQLRGSISPERAWWDVQHYALALEVLPATRSLRGSNTITFKTLTAGSRMQIDLQPPLAITAVEHQDRALAFEREGNVWWVSFPDRLPAGAEHSIVVRYEGKPRVSTRPPWSGGLSWQKDEHGLDFIATTCQGIGASIWWPNKDHGADEPDRGMDLHVTVPAALTAVANGRLIATTADDARQTRTFHWRVVNPINNYGVNVNIGNYVSIDGKYEGEGGTLDLQYWVLAHQVEQAERQFVEVPRTLAAFEHWFGRYPFYEDGYKLVVVPYLGMEHQSSVTYGNGFRNGYLGRDLSRTGVGLKFDFIIVHESAHEWWGNNISMRDAADMWIHESFANYAENLFVEYHFSAEEAQDYVIGCRALIQNDEPIIGTYGVNKSGSGDMYYKGGNMLHTMRHMLDDDRRWRAMLRGLNREFRHRTVGTAEVEAYISRACGRDFGKVFDQYLRGTKVPVVCWRAIDGKVEAWFEDVVDGFRAPVVLRLDGVPRRVELGQQPALVPSAGAVAGVGTTVELDRNFWMQLQAR
ncbi:MAG: M1 family metallopeptidase [Planctomycetes bacterium]|jgi:aminopeptidase N|nr:M1 family metallopeptidase [Planctomycetota bacterium]